MLDIPGRQATLPPPALPLGNRTPGQEVRGAPMAVVGNSESLPESRRRAQSCVQTPALDWCYRRDFPKKPRGAPPLPVGVSPQKTRLELMLRK